MKFFPGCLQDRLQKARTPKEAIEICSQIADSVEAAVRHSPSHKEMDEGAKIAARKIAELIRDCK